MIDGRDDEIAFLTGCREHASVPTSVPRPRGTPFVFVTEPRPPRRARRRRLYLGDLVIAVVVMSLGSVGMRHVAANLGLGAGRPARVFDVAASAVPLGMAAAGLLAAYRLRWGRRRDGPPVQEPGFVAGVMLVLAMGFSLAAYVTRAIRYEIHIEYDCSTGPNPTPCKHPGWVAPDPRYLEGAFFRDVAGGCGPAVAAGWLVLLATGRCKPRRDWIDIAGCALGVLWIAASVTRGLD
jgi:hypothetical protein